MENMDCGLSCKICSHAESSYKQRTLENTVLVKDASEELQLFIP